MIIDGSLPYVLWFLIGITLGFFYFGGLWFTVKKVPVSSNPKWLLFWSAVFRFVPTLLILFLAARVNPSIFFSMLPGFIGVRYFMIRRVAKVNRGQIRAA